MPREPRPARVSQRRPSASPAATRERLLEAAETLFAERGYRDTPVRAITSTAGCNLAAVNYHFGGKLPLYREMFRRRLRDLRERRIRGIRESLREAGKRADLETLLRSFTTAFLEPHMEGRAGRRLMKLFMREMFDPHLQPSVVRREIVKPVQDAMMEALGEVGVDLREPAARRCVQSVVAQLVHVVQMRASRAASSAGAGADFAFPGIIDHIVRFSAAGIRAYARP